MSVKVFQATTPEGSEFVGRVFVLDSQGGGVIAPRRYEDVVMVRVKGSFAGGIPTDSNKVAAEHSWDGVTWAEAGAAAGTGNVAVEAIVTSLRPFVRINVTVPAATYTGTVQLIGGGAST